MAESLLIYLRRSYYKLSKIVFLDRLHLLDSILEFLKKRVRQYQEKKLNEILSNIQFHQRKKSQLEQKLEGMAYGETTKIREEISFNDKMIEIWQRNEQKLRRQMNDIED